MQPPIPAHISKLQLQHGYTAVPYCPDDTKITAQHTLAGFAGATPLQAFLYFFLHNIPEEVHMLQVAAHAYLTRPPHASTSLQYMPGPHSCLPCTHTRTHTHNLMPTSRKHLMCLQSLSVPHCPPSQARHATLVPCVASSCCTWQSCSVHLGIQKGAAVAAPPAQVEFQALLLAMH